MFLKKIELNGFKSFASKTEVIFCSTKGNVEERFGVTAVVGPNGSGKSNIADAIRWVMGEQSAKNLRGKKTHDVIFGGSDKKSKMGTASVTLLFDNSDKKLDIDFETVSVTRKVHRSGEGEYCINGSRVRLLDVVDLFASMGIGKESQCVLNQGMSDAILSATPLERRNILEEAAGVKLYQIKRDRSIRKLHNTRENLTQTAQIIEEIEPRLRILKRQAKRAEQRREVEEELRKVQNTYYGRTWHEIKKQYQQYEEVVGALGREMKVLERKVDELVEKQNKASKKMQDTSRQDVLRKEIVLIRRDIADLERRKAQSQGFIDAEKERFKRRRSFDVIPVDLPFVRKRLSGLTSSLEEILTLLDGMSELEKWKEYRPKVTTLGEAIKTLSQDCSKTTVRIEHSGEKQAREKEMFLARIAKGEAEIELLSRKIEEKEKLVFSKEAEGEKVADDVQSSNEAFFSLEKEIQSVRLEMEQLRSRHNDQKIEMTRCEVHLEDMDKEIRAETGRDPDSFDGNVSGEEIHLPELEQYMGRLRSKLAMIGGIDPMIAQEYAQTQERYDLLVRESQDLEEAIISLEKIIQEMNERIEKDFRKAFITINKEFGRYFALMFDGGSASLEKVRIAFSEKEKQDDKEEEGEDSTTKEQDDDSGQWGIEIKVHPPKKKIERLAMLSGGERSLISLALLFGIIANNPPPFVVLDEVEAALDEVNSRRFGDLLQTLAHDTQFIVITHNRETMQQSDVLYGVTMNGGISQLLSVRLDQVKKAEDSTEK